MFTYVTWLQPCWQFCCGRKQNLPKTPTVCLVLTCWNVLLLRYDGSTKEASFSIGLQGMAEEDTERVKQIISQTIDDIIEYVAHSHSIIGVRISTTGLRECNRNAKRVVSPLRRKQDRLRGGTNWGAPPQDRDPDEAPVHQLWPVSGLGEFTASLSRAVFINLCVGGMLPSH